MLILGMLVVLLRRRKVRRIEDELSFCMVKVKVLLERYKL
jgi:hypothetical protein